MNTYLYIVTIICLLLFIASILRDLFITRRITKALEKRTVVLTGQEEYKLLMRNKK